MASVVPGLPIHGVRAMVAIGGVNRTTFARSDPYPC
jgi:hypothetical protein